MKKRLLLITYCFNILSFAFAQQYGWQVINPGSIGGSPDFSDVHVVNENIALISSSSGANIYRTYDGAASFSIQVTSLGTATEAIYMTDSLNGFCGGGSGFVYNTADGGNNWGYLGAIPSTLTELDFVSASQGYVCGDAGAVFSITPQGVTNLNSGFSTNLSGISAPSVNNVWVCGGATISYFNGVTFEFQLGPGGTYNSIFFINDNEGWVVGNSGLIGHTEDGGDNWTQQYSPNNNSLYDVFFLNTEVGWAVGSQGTIIYTSDGGDTWTVVGAGLTTAFLRGVQFVSAINGNVGYVVGNGKTLLKYGEISGVEDKAENLEIEINPNPSKDQFEVRCTAFKIKKASIEIFDLNGRKLFEKDIPAGTENIKIDISRFESGVYFCKIRSDMKSAMKKLIIE